MIEFLGLYIFGKWLYIFGINLDVGGVDVGCLRKVLELFNFVVRFGDKSLLL